MADMVASDLWVHDLLVQASISLDAQGSTVKELHDTKAGVEVLIIGFLLSPYGLPAVEAMVIAFIEVMNDRIRAA